VADDSAYHALPEGQINVNRARPPVASCVVIVMYGTPRSTTSLRRRLKPVADDSSLTLVIIMTYYDSAH
jgi:hypothetical protein